MVGGKGRRSGCNRVHKEDLYYILSRYNTRASCDTRRII